MKKYLKEQGFPGIYEHVVDLIFVKDISSRVKLWQLISEEPFRKHFEGDISLRNKMPSELSTEIMKNVQNSRN